jgi:hypothetical protein
MSTPGICARLTGSRWQLIHRSYSTTTAGTGGAGMPVGVPCVVGAAKAGGIGAAACATECAAEAGTEGAAAVTACCIAGGGNAMGALLLLPEHVEKLIPSCITKQDTAGIMAEVVTGGAVLVLLLVANKKKIAENRAGFHLRRMHRHCNVNNIQHLLYVLHTTDQIQCDQTVCNADS